MAPASNSGNGVAVRLLLILAAAVVLAALVMYYNRRQQQQSGGNERFTAGAPVTQDTLIAPAVAGANPRVGSQAGAPVAFAPAEVSSAAAFGPPMALEATGTEQHRPVPGGDPFTAAVTAPRDPFPQDRITPEQLLPSDAANSKWAQANPAGQGDLRDQNLLTAGYHLGQDTQGNSLRNASHDIRSTPPCPRYQVSVWQQSTIAPDMSRRPLE